MMTILLLIAVEAEICKSKVDSYIYTSTSRNFKLGLGPAFYLCAGAVNLDTNVFENQNCSRD